MKRGKRLTALLLALAMCLSVLPANVLAAELGSETEAVESVEAEPTEPENTEEAAETVAPEESQTTESGEPAQEPEEDTTPTTMAATSGTCGKNVIWKLDSKGTLTISGTGEMESDIYGHQPWYSSRGKIKSVVIKNGVTSIGDPSFGGCSNLTSVTIADSVTTIASGAFSSCEKLEKIEIPAGVISIGWAAFFDCSSLKSIDIPDSVTSIDDCAFKKCSSLTNITVPDSVTSIGDAVFMYSDLKEIYFNGSAPTFIEGEEIITGYEENVGTLFNVTATAYYPENDPTWTSDKLKDYGGNITWKTWNPETDSADSDFDAAIYQAKYTFNHDDNYQQHMFQDSPTKVLYELGEKEGLATSASAWRAVTKALDAADKPSTVVGREFEKKDMYSAIIMSIFETESQNSHTLLQRSDWAVKASGKLFDYLQKAMKLKFNIELTKNYDLSKLTKVQKQSLFKMANEYMEQQDSVLKWISGKIDIAEMVMGYVNQFSEWCDYVSSCSMLVSMDCYNKQIMRKLYQSATNIDMRDALGECIEIMDSNQEALYIREMLKLEDKIINEGAKACVDVYWKAAKTAVEKANPYVALIWKSYENSKKLCNALFNTDKISENYCKLGIVLQMEDVLNKVYQNIKSDCNTELSHENAELFNHVFRLLYNCYDVDCQYALNFVTAVDDAAISVIKRGLKLEDRKALKAQINHIQKDTEDIYWTCNNAWIMELTATNADQYPKYKQYLHYNLLDTQVTLSDQSMTYTGKKLTPNVTVKDTMNIGVKPVHYKVSYSKNKNVGTATVTVTGTRLYYGTVQKTFRINPKGTSLSKLTNSKGKKMTVTWKKNSAVTGYQVQYSTSKSFKSPKTVTVKKAKTTSTTIKKLTKGKKYYVRVRTYQKVGSKTYYSSWSSSKTVTIKK